MPRLERLKTSQSKHNPIAELSVALRLTLLLAGIGAITGLSASGQDDIPTIITRVEEVVVPFSVKDGDRPVPGLSAQDFAVFEDGRQQTIVSFDFEAVPLSAVLLLDTGIPRESIEALDLARTSLVKAFSLTPQARALMNADEVAVYSFNNEVKLVQDFTEDEDVLRSTLEFLEDHPGGPGLVGGGTIVDSPVFNGVPVIPTAPEPVRGDRRVLHDAIYEAALVLRSRDPDRRRVIFVVSDGSEKDSEVSYEEVQLRLMETETQVFALSVNTGLRRIFDTIVSSLDEYADFTGGDVYSSGPDNLDPLFARMMGGARSQYVLIYNSTNEAPSNRVVFRRIDVRSVAGYRVLHKAGYYQVP